MSTGSVFDFFSQEGISEKLIEGDICMSAQNVFCIEVKSQKTKVESARIEFCRRNFFFIICDVLHAAFTGGCGRVQRTKSFFLTYRAHLTLSGHVSRPIVKLFCIWRSQSGAINGTVGNGQGDHLGRSTMVNGETRAIPNTLKIR